MPKNPKTADKKRQRQEKALRDLTAKRDRAVSLPEQVSIDHEIANIKRNMGVA